VIQEEYRGKRRWSRNAQAVAIVVWISFLAAAAGTMLFFAFFDPVDLAASLDVDLSRQAGYAIGFFFFWLLCVAAAAPTAWLVRTAPRRDERAH
jgi:hypothetical protein